jgi:hypothetical protein
LLANSNREYLLAAGLGTIIEEMKLSSIIILLLLLASGSDADALSHKNLTLPDLQTAEYKVGSIGESADLETLHIGKRKSPYPEDTCIYQTYLLDYAFGDINGDGLGDAVAVIALNTGGSGDFTYLTALINHQGKATCVAWETLGDRSRCNKLKIVNEKIICDMMMHAPSDPACNPTLRRVLKYNLVKNKLIGPHDVN